MDPHCMFGGYILSQYFHGSIVYWLTTMLRVNLYRAWACLPRDDLYILFDVCLQLSSDSPIPAPPACVKCFGHQCFF
jgi:hypothetical protein